MQSFFKRQSGDVAGSDAPEPSAASRTATDSAAEDVESRPEDGVHGITRSTDHWFERRAHALEQRAALEAAQWAQAGLPMQDVRRTEPLDVEVVLASHARQVYREWAERVRTKMQDAIARGSRAFGEQVAELRTRVGRLDAIAQDLGAREAKIERIRDESARDTAPIQYHRLVPGVLFWPMALLLVLVEFAANFPVFRLLLPMDSVLAGAARVAAGNIRETSWLAGLELLGRSLLMNVEASLVALVVVIALVVLGKQAGASARPLVALSAREQPLGATTIRQHRRQHSALLGICVAGLVATIGFLYSARGGIAATAQSRVTQDSVARAELNAKLRVADSTGNRAAIGTLTQESIRLSKIEERHKDDAAYARTVQGNNDAILFLNLGLIAVAAALGFAYAKDNLSDRRGEHPDLPVLREKCAELRREQLAVIGEARAALSRAAGAEGAVRHLASASPLASWESKARRLAAVVAVFRAENARVRGMDPTNIRAFDVAVDLGLPDLRGESGFALPDEMASFAAERDELAARLERHRVHSSGAVGGATISTTPSGGTAAVSDVNRSGPRRAAEVAA